MAISILELENLGKIEICYRWKTTHFLPPLSTFLVELTVE